MNKECCIPRCGGAFSVESYIFVGLWFSPWKLIWYVYVYNIYIYSYIYTHSYIYIYTQTSYLPQTQQLLAIRAGLANLAWSQTKEPFVLILVADVCIDPGPAICSAAPCMFPTEENPSSSTVAEMPRHWLLASPWWHQLEAQIVSDEPWSNLAFFFPQFLGYQSK